jgi:hypothetical protein
MAVVDPRIDLAAVARELVAVGVADLAGAAAEPLLAGCFEVRGKKARALYAAAAAVLRIISGLHALMSAEGLGVVLAEAGVWAKAVGGLATLLARRAGVPAVGAVLVGA